MYGNNNDGRGPPYNDMQYQPQHLQNGPPQQGRPHRPDSIDAMMRQDRGRMPHPGPSNDNAFNESWFQGSAPPARPLTGMAGPGSYPSMFSPPSAVASGSGSRTGDTVKNKKTPKRRPEENVEEKRTKTGRACDACRSKKIRCDILQSDASTAEANDVPPICAHCKQYNLECTFFLPIAETRFKKRRTNNDESSPPAKPADPGSVKPEIVMPKHAPTSITSLLHSAAPVNTFEQYDIRNHSHWEISEDGHGKIKIEAVGEGSDCEEATRLAKYVLPGSVMTTLINQYFDFDWQFLPIVLRSDFLTKKQCPLLLYSICAFVSTRREFPRHVFYRLRGLVNGLMRANEILSNATLSNVQALLIMTLSGELHAQPTAPTASAANMRLGSAIRMAQDLGLHRESKVAPKSSVDLEQVELRRRIWAACVFLDRWYVAALGLPQVIDIHDCDVLIPAPYSIVHGKEPSEWPTNAPFMVLIENLKLAILFGRVFKMLYGPAGLQHATDEGLESLRNDLIEWHKNLPEQLEFKGNASTMLPAWLHIEFTAVVFLFLRGFMRVTHQPPSHLKFTLDQGQWAELVGWSRQCIEWLDTHDNVLDTVFIWPYSATSCALIQYHTWARKRDPATLESLKLVRDVVTRWEKALQPDQMSIRRRTCETMMLLYEAALKTQPESDDHRTDRSEGTPASVTSSGAARPSAAQSHSEGTPTSANLAPSGRANGHRRIGSNVNPQLSVVEGDGPQNAQYSHEPDTEPSILDDTGELDISFLDSIPDLNFDWTGWGQYFDTVDRIFPTAPDEHENGD